MYNEDRKRKFISDSAQWQRSTEYLLEGLFDNVGRFEEKYQRDFAEMDVRQVEDVLNAVTGLRSKSIETVHVFLKSYVRWCGDHGFETSDAIDNAEIDTIKKVRSSMVSSPAHLSQVLDIVFPDPDNVQTSFVYRSFLWLAFMGARSSEAVCVHAEDLDFTKMLLTVKTASGNEKTCPIYAEAVYDLSKARDLKEFRFEESRRGYFKRKLGESILRGASIKPSSADSSDDTDLIYTLRPLLTRAFNRTSQINPVKNLTYRRTYLSGVFYRTYELERMGRAPDFTEYIESDYNDKQATYGYDLSGSQTDAKIKYRMKRGYEQDYIKWKYAFMA